MRDEGGKEYKLGENCNINLGEYCFVYKEIVVIYEEEG